MPYPSKEYKSLYTEAVFPTVSPWPGQMTFPKEGREGQRDDQHSTKSCSECETSGDADGGVQGGSCMIKVIIYEIS